MNVEKSVRIAKRRVLYGMHMYYLSFYNITQNTPELKLYRNWKNINTKVIKSTENIQFYLVDTI